MRVHDALLLISQTSQLGCSKTRVNEESEDHARKRKGGSKKQDQTSPLSSGGMDNELC